MVEVEEQNDGGGVHVIMFLYLCVCVCMDTSMKMNDRLLEFYDIILGEPQEMLELALRF